MAVTQRLTVAEFLELDTPRWAILVDGEVVVNLRARCTSASSWIWRSR